MSRYRHAVSLSAALAAAALLSSGCKAPSQVVLGFATDLSAPDVLDRVEMRVRDSAGTELLAENWDLPGLLSRDFSLPGSFALYADGGAEPTVRIELVGKRGGKDGQVIVTRNSSILFASEATLFFRMALVERCMGMSCGTGSSCIEGKCRPEEVNTVSLLPYHNGMEAQVACSSGSRLVDTGSKQAMAVEGDGYCGANEWCGESTCYRNQGQGLLWCNPAGNTCAGVDGYEGCLVNHCDAPIAVCYGASWRRGQFEGACRDYADCRTACNCDGTCISRCDQARSPECTTCLGPVDSCVAQADLTCSEPSCQPIPAGPPGDMGGVGDMGGMSLMDQVPIPAGTYFIGCDPADAKHPDPDCASDAQPLHPVKLSSFRIDRLEVSQKQYSECVVAGDCTIMPEFSYMPAVTPALPVVALPWQAAQTYCAYAGKRISALMGRLPTESEWEVAAHGTPGMVGAGSIYPWGDAPPTADCSQSVNTLCMPMGVRDVGGRPAGKSAFGVEDLSGNVAEWVGDWYSPTEYTDQLSLGTSMPNPQGPASSPTGERSKRGGQFAQPMDGVSVHELAATTRYAATPDTVSDIIGFRCVYIP